MDENQESVKIDCTQLLQKVQNLSASQHGTELVVPSLAMVQLPLEMNEPLLHQNKSTVHVDTHAVPANKSKSDSRSTSEQLQHQHEHVPSSASKGPSLDWKISKTHAVQQKIFHRGGEREKKFDSSRFLVGSRRNRDGKQSNNAMVHDDHSTKHPDATASDTHTDIPSESSTTAAAASSSLQVTREWYLLVASTPFSISAQLSYVDSSEKKPILLSRPDSTLSSPLLVWEAASPLTNNTGEEILTSTCTILIQDRRETEHTSSQYLIPQTILRAAIVVGTNRSRVLSFQLDIRLDHLVDQVSNNNSVAYYTLCLPAMTQDTCIEPLPLDLPCHIEDHEILSDTMTQQNLETPELKSIRATKQSRKKHQINNFHPAGGVTSIQPYYMYPTASSWASSPWMVMNKNSHLPCFVWVTYADGTMVRLMDVEFFSKHSTVYPHSPTPQPDSRKERDIHVLHPSGPDNQIFIPFPRSFTTILSQPWDVHRSTYTVSDEDESSPNASLDESQHSDKEGYDFIHREQVFEAISFCKDMQGDIATLSFYSSEDQFRSNLTMQESKDDESKSPTNRDNSDGFISILKTTNSSIVGGTASIAKGVLGGFMEKFILTGYPTWRQSKRDTAVPEKNVEDHPPYPSQHLASDKTRNEDDINYEISDEERDVNYDFQLSYPKPLYLPFTGAIFDIPRKITNLTIDPVGGDLAACADNLGRVQLIDLNMKQVVRLWKGMRDATCHWMTWQRGATPWLYLLIHARQRNVVEIYRVRHGPREDMIQMKANDSHILQCHVLGLREDVHLKCFVFSPTDRSVESIIVKRKDEYQQQRSVGISSKLDVTWNPTMDSDTSMPLRLLQQLLTSEFDGRHSSDPNAVLDAFKQVTVIHDLIRAIDILAMSSSLEERMGIIGSSFHHQIISVAEMRFDQMKANEVTYSAHYSHLLSELSLKLQIHKQIIAAYDVTNRFQNSYKTEKINIASLQVDLDTTDDEAQNWIHTIEKVTGCTIDSSQLPDEESREMNFFTFARCCLQSNHETVSTQNGNHEVKIFLCASTRERKKVLVHIFRPLIIDRFTIKPVREVFELLGIYHDRDVLLQYFGEWFISLRLHKVNVKSAFSDRSPSVGFLESIIEEDLPKLIEGSVSYIPGLLLARLQSFCSSCEDLPRAFLLAQTCLKAVISGTRQLEEKCYGVVNQSDCVNIWEALMNKLRIALLISIRMSSAPPSSSPITVDNIEDGTIFSIFEWIARDELRITHRQEDLVCLEKICESIKETDNKSKWKGMQQSCVDENNRLSPLLYFLRHYNDKHLLAAHRALILSSMWGRRPEHLDLLVDATHAIRILDSGKSLSKKLSTVIRAEIWYTVLRPLYRVILFGFDQVYELNEDSLSCLFSDRYWIQEVFRISLDLLKMLEKSDKRAESFNSFDLVEPSKLHSILWPPLKGDIILQSLIRRWWDGHFKSIPEHRGLICALYLSDDIERIKSCFPEAVNLFLGSSNLEKPFVQNESKVFHDKKKQFILESLRSKAEVSDFGLDEVMYLGNWCGLDKEFVFTSFILCMYELNKDEQVDDLVSASVRLLNIPLFLNGCIEIISLRLSVILNAMKNDKRYRSSLSSLDADTCQFVHELSGKASLVRPMIKEENIISSLHSSNSLALRVMRLSTNIRTGEIHSLSIMIGTLLQTLQIS